MRYSLKNLCSMFTKQRLLSLLLVLNIVVSCFVICFSYGLYQSYNVVIEEGENPVYKELTIKASDGKKHRSDEYEIDLSEVTIGEFTAMLTSLSDDLTDNISSIDLFLGVDQDLYCECTDQEALSDTGVYANYIHLDVKHHMIISGGTDVGCISDEDYSSGKKLVALGTEMFGSHGGTIGYSSKSYTAVPLTDEKNITIEGEPYEILRINRHLDGRMIFPITSLSDDKLLWAEPISNDVFTIRFNEPIKVSQYSELHDTIDQYFRGKVTTPSLKFKNAEELYYYRTVLIISVLIALLVSVNMTVLYRYILERRSRELAIFRICGCTGRSAVMMYLAECLTVSLPLFALTELFWHKLLMKRIARLFEHFEGAYSPKLYAAVFGIYAVSVTVVMYIMIRATVKKHSLAELKTEAHSAGFLIFKVLETVQLSAVLVLIVAIWSAGMSRYDLYSPFADLLRGKGYVVNYQGAYMYGDDFRKMVEGSDAYLTGWIDYSIDSGSESASFRCIAYDKELTDRFKPQLKEGSWLNETDHSYLSDGEIPVIVPPDSPYNIGEKLLSPNNIIAWDENYITTKTEDLTFTVVGKLSDNAAVFSFPYPMGALTDHLSLYGTYNGEFIDEDALLMREQDVFDIYGMHPPVMGIQLVSCGSIEDEEYKQLGKSLYSLPGASVSSFEEINKASHKYIFEQLKTVFPIAVCIFILTVISSISISAIYTKRHLHDYAILYICGATWRSCALRSLRSGLITCGASVMLTAAVLFIGKLTFMEETVISFGLISLAVCAGVLIVYLALSMIMPLLIIGKTEPREILKEE